LATVFLGSGEFSRDLLTELLRSGYGITSVITPQDRPAGRGLKLRPTAVKALAEAEGLEVLQPSGPADSSFLDALRGTRPDVLLVADYGYVLPGTVLGFPSRGCVNVHPSLLPRYRGAAPIQRALMEGESETGVTLMLMDEGLDTGPVIASEKVAIEEEDDALTLRGKLALLGARLVLEELPGFLSGKTVPRPQEEGHATYADPIRKEEAAIDWTRDAMTIFNQVRALSPRPGAHTWLEGKRVKILRARPRQDVAAAPGKVAAAAGDALVVGAGEQALQVYELQPEGRKVMGAGEFMRGYRISEGDLFA